MAIIVMNWILASSGRPAIYTTALAACSTSIRGSTAISPLACQNAFLHSFRQGCRGIADVDLAARDVVFAPVERQGFRQPCHGMLGCRVRCRVGPRNVCGNGSIVDDAATWGSLVFHHPVCFLGAKKDAVQIHANNGLPLFKTEVFKRHPRSADSGIIEKHVETAKYFLRSCEERLNRIGIADVGWNGQCRCATARIAQSLV